MSNELRDAEKIMSDSGILTKIDSEHRVGVGLLQIDGNLSLLGRRTTTVAVAQIVSVEIYRSYIFFILSMVFLTVSLYLASEGNINQSYFSGGVCVLFLLAGIFLSPYILKIKLANAESIRLNSLRPQFLRKLKVALEEQMAINI